MQMKRRTLKGPALVIEGAGTCQSSSGALLAVNDLLWSRNQDQSSTIRSKSQYRVDRGRIGRFPSPVTDTARLRVGGGVGRTRHQNRSSVGLRVCPREVRVMARNAGCRERRCQRIRSSLDRNTGGGNCCPSKCARLCASRHLTEGTCFVTGKAV